MPLQMSDSGVTIGDVTVPFVAFEALVRRHLVLGPPSTVDVERRTARSEAEGFSARGIQEFVKSVCNWGGYPGIAGRVLKSNSIEWIRGQLLAALEILDSEAPNAAAALQQVNRIHDLGKPSFASKHLRFLRPQLCPVLDSVLSGHLGYPLNVSGYGSYAEDALRVAERLQTLGIPNPMKRSHGRWFAADVDMAVFACAQTESGATGWEGSLASMIGQSEGGMVERIQRALTGAKSDHHPMPQQRTTTTRAPGVRFARLSKTYGWHPGELIRVIEDDGKSAKVLVEWRPEDNQKAGKLEKWKLMRRNMAELD